MARLRPETIQTGRTIAVIDDNREFLRSTERLLRREGHAVHAFESPVAALEWLRENPVELILVDFFMPEMTGEMFVNQLRDFNALVQVILQTGYASEQPAREILRRLSIQGYFDKSEGPDKLLLWVEVGLRAAQSLQALERSRAGLRYILDVTPELHRPKPIADLLQGILLQTTGLLGVVDSFLAVVAAQVPATDGFVALVDDASLKVCAGTGRYAPASDAPAPAALQRVREVLASGEIQVKDGSMVVPLGMGQVPVGAIYLDRAVAGPRDLELLQVFANQATVAVQNSYLYEMAAFDTLTGVFTRRFFQHALARELRVAHRNRQPLALLLVDVDRMKRINDQGGHLAGDAALRAVGDRLRASTRATDVIGRYGGDEFALVLPGTPRAGAEVVVRRIQAALGGTSITAPTGETFPVRASVGVAVLEPPEGAVFDGEAVAAVERALLQRADESLYHAKRGREE